LANSSTSSNQKNAKTSSQPLATMHADGILL
jgi:hypothetical protein